MKIYFLITSMTLTAISCIMTDVHARVTLLTISLILLYADQIAEIINTQNVKKQEDPEVVKDSIKPKETTLDFTLFN